MKKQLKNSYTATFVKKNNEQLSFFSKKTKCNAVSIMCTLGLMAASMEANALAFNRIQAENALPGNPEWTGFARPNNPHDLEGYTDKDSVNVGNPIKFYVNTNPSLDKTFTITIYRLGWYKGVGGRRVATSIPINSFAQTLPIPDPTSGLIQANWIKPITLNVPTSWVSGIYVATLIGNTTKQGQYIPFIVRDVNRSSDYLFQASTTTWQAYNNWGGKSLYSYNSDSIPVGTTTTGTNIPSRKISFNRPYDMSTGSGSGGLFNWEINMLRFMEREGYNVTYQSNLDTHVGDGGLLNHKAILSVGHDEYWSKSIRDNFENAQKYGIGLGFFGANAGYWQVRMENGVGALANQANRTMVGYKDLASVEDPYALDSITDNNILVTGQWRAPLWANRPENSLIGIMYSFYPVDGAVVTNKTDPSLGDATTSHWIYTGTKTTVGTHILGTLGYEADRIFNNGLTPANLELIASSDVPTTSVDQSDFPYDDLTSPKSHMTAYTKPCTVLRCINPVSTVFATGTLQWPWGLDSYNSSYENDTAKIMTRNVLARMINMPIPGK